MTTPNVALDTDRRMTDLLCEQITIAQAALVAADELLNDLSVGGEDGEFPPLDHADAVAELLAVVLDDLAGEA